MPHDKTGRLVRKGDIVLVEMEVYNVDSSPDFCNCTLKIQGEHGPHNITGSLTLNTKQVVVIDKHLEEVLPQGSSTKLPVVSVPKPATQTGGE